MPYIYSNLLQVRWTFCISHFIYSLFSSHEIGLITPILEMMWRVWYQIEMLDLENLVLNLKYEIYQLLGGHFILILTQLPLL